MTKSKIIRETILSFLDFPTNYLFQKLLNKVKPVKKIARNFSFSYTPNPKCFDCYFQLDLMKENSLQPKNIQNF